MAGLHKSSSKTRCIALAAAICVAVTWKSEARRVSITEIYSTLTTDTIPTRKKSAPLTPAPQLPSPQRPVTRSSGSDTIPVMRPGPPSEPPITDSSNRRTDTSFRPANDTFALRFSKDTLDAEVNYEASDSGVLLVKEKKFILYSRTKTVYKDYTLAAPKVEFDQATNIATAFNEKDSAGNIVRRVQFRSSTDNLQADTLRFNFKNQKGFTTNTFTQKDEFFLQVGQSKKIDANTMFAKHFTMTTCEYDHPHFGFVSERGKFITNKVAITGPIHPEFEGVPVPIFLPFGIFPLKSTRHSGLLPPQFTVNEQFGLGLEGLGYYQVLNDYLDVTTRGNIYSYGGWSVNVIPSYRKRYRYNGSMSLGFQRTKFNFKGDPDFNLVKTFNITWNHTVDQRARPGTTFSASVNASSTRYNEFVATNPQRPFNNQQTSSIAYSKSWQDRPYNLTLSANHSQNNLTHVISLTLPDAGFTVATLYPFQRKEPIGPARWFEKIGVGYTGIARNQFAFVDTNKISLPRIIDTLMWGAQHRFPINMTLPPLGPLLVAPFVSYEETWLTRRLQRQWNPNLKKVDTLYDRKGLFIDRQMSFGVGLNTALYGTKVFRGGKLIAIRHVVRPNLNFNYRPNLSKKYYDVIQVDTSGRRQAIAQFETSRNLFSSYGYGQFGGITFGVDNNIEAKVRTKDTRAVNEGKKGEKKIRLIDGFGFTSGYNFLQDSLRLLPFNLYLRTTLFDKISITAQALYNPYQQDSTGSDINRFVWQGDRFSLGRFRGGSVTMSANFQSKPRDPKKAPQQQATRPITDPALLADRDRLQDYMQRNPAEFVDFNIPWTFSVSLALSFTPERLANGSYKNRITSNTSFNSSFSLTPKWNFTTTGYYDFNTMRLTMFNMSISRDLHCWQMAVNVTPIGQFHTFNFTISPKSSVLQDLKVNRTRTYYNY